MEKLVRTVLPSSSNSADLQDVPLKTTIPMVEVEEEIVDIEKIDVEKAAEREKDVAANGGKKRQFELNESDFEDIIMGEMLTQDHIYYAQMLLKAQFSNFNGLQSTLIQNKPVSTCSSGKVTNKLQVIHCNGNHWIAASNVKHDGHYDVAVYDSIYRTINNDTDQIIYNLFQKGEQKPVIKVMNCQKQVGGKDCGLFAIAFVTSIAYGDDPVKTRFLQDKMRFHLVKCFRDKKMEKFPCKL